jgi:hypothetical protein
MELYGKTIMNGECVKIWKKTTVTCTRVLSQRSTEEIYDEPEFVSSSTFNFITPGRFYFSVSETLSFWLNFTQGIPFWK